MAQDLTAALADALKAHETLPAFPNDLALEDAAKLQDQVVQRLCAGGSAGLKAGMTSPGLQEFFKLDGALLGQLYPQGRLEAGAILPHLPKLSIECEIGIVVDANGAPKSVGPAIEFVYLDFANPQDMTAANLLATNLAADRFMPGPQFPWRALYNDITLRLTRDGEVVNEASVMESLGGPATALPWMCAEAKRRNIPLADNMLFMTGTCGGVVPAEPGHYVGEYGELGSVEFTVE